MDLLDTARQDIKDFVSRHPDGIVIVFGQTAAGKTRLSIWLSEFFDIEVISADSRQVYRYMDIGTDKIGTDIREKILHHQIDIINPDEIYTAWERQSDSYKIIDKIKSSGKIPFIVWWTGLYIDTIYYNFTLPTIPPDPDYRKSLEVSEIKNPGTLWTKLQEIDPIEASKNHPNSTRYIIRALEIHHKIWKTKSELMQRQPVRYPILMFGLDQDINIWNKLIDERIEQMLGNWLVDEVRWLLDMWYDPNTNSLQTIDYKQVIWYLMWDYGYDDMVSKLQIVNHQLAKKQRTRFRRYKNDMENNPIKDVVYKFYDINKFNF